MEVFIAIMINQLIAKKRHDAAAEALGKSAESFNKAQVDLIETGLYVVEKMVLYSAGSISLSITFLGYLLGHYELLLAEKFLSVPIYYILYLSWALSAITIVTGILAKSFDAYYRYYVAVSDYFTANKQQEEKVRDLANVGVPIFLEKGGTIDDFLQETTGRVDRYSKKIAKYKKQEAFWFKLKMWILNSAIISFVFEILLLVLFAILITNRIITV